MKTQKQNVWNHKKSSGRLIRQKPTFSLKHPTRNIPVTMLFCYPTVKERCKPCLNSNSVAWTWTHGRSTLFNLTTKPHHHQNPNPSKGSFAYALTNIASVLPAAVPIFSQILCSFLQNHTKGVTTLIGARHLTYSPHSTPLGLTSPSSHIHTLLFPRKGQKLQQTPPTSAWGMVHRPHSLFGMTP